MTYTERIIKEAKENGIKVDTELKKGLKSLQKMIDITKSVKGSPSKIWEELHCPATHK